VSGLFVAALNKPDTFSYIDVISVNIWAVDGVKDLGAE
jgi:hypothetical protein